MHNSPGRRPAPSHPGPGIRPRGAQVQAGQPQQQEETGDAYLFVTPEYNHSVPGVLKNAIDSVFATFAFRGKPASCVGYSGGIGGGTRAIEHLAHVAIEAEMVPLRNAVIIPFVHSAFRPDGQPSDPRTSAAAKILLDDLAWWAKALRQARLGGALPPAAFRLMAAEEGAGK
jgi:NAD(P)H-dependent FMN reductase